MPKISVIVPVYNVEKYLPKCIDSILTQTFTDFELILVDDGSPDNCGQICDEYVLKDTRIKVIHKQNGGLSDARNFGIDASNGEYLTFVDSDDWVKKDYLLTMYQNIIVHNADISAVNLHKEYDNDFEKSYDIKEGLYSGIDCLKFLYENETSIYANVACAKLYRKELFKKIKYPVGKIHEDGYTTYKLYCIAQKVYFSESDLYCYYQRSNSIMNQKFSLNKIHEYYVYKERSEFFKKNKLDDLLLQNEKAKISCVFSLTVKINSSDFSKKEKKTWFRFFKNDIKQIDLYFFKKFSMKEKISICAYKISATCYCGLNYFSQLYRRLKNEK